MPRSPSAAAVFGGRLVAQPHGERGRALAHARRIGDAVEGGALEPAEPVEESKRQRVLVGRDDGVRSPTAARREPSAGAPKVRPTSARYSTDATNPLRPS